MEPGIYYDMSMSDYLAIPAISNSGLTLVNRSPAHYRAGFRKSTKAMDMGTAIHCAVLEPDRFATDYLLLRDVTDRRSAAYKQACAEVAEAKALIAGEVKVVEGASNAVRDNPHCAALISGNIKTEVSVVAVDPETGVRVKCRFDALQDGNKGRDLKKTQDIRDFYKAIANYRYHCQEAFYRDVYYWATGSQLEDFAFIVVEEQPPHANRPIRIDSESLEIGRMVYREDLNEYARCLASGVWPGAAGEPEVVGLPTYEISKFEETLGVVWS